MGQAALGGQGLALWACLGDFTVAAKNNGTAFGGATNHSLCPRWFYLASKRQPHLGGVSLNPAGGLISNENQQGRLIQQYLHLLQVQGH